VDGLFLKPLLNNVSFNLEAWKSHLKKHKSLLRNGFI